MKRNLIRSALAAALAGSSLSLFAWSWEWGWGMPGEVYKGLEFSSRAGVDRATKVFSAAWEAKRRGTKEPDLVPQFRAAAAEWRKVEIQAQAENANDDLLAYAVFMQGFSKMHAHDRNEAIKYFNNVIDIYEDQVWATFDARYWLAQVKLDMGETKSGWAMMEELAEDTDNAKHPLMGHILNSLGWRAWGAFKEFEAQELWRRGTDPAFCEQCRSPWQSCRDGLHLACVVRGDFQVFEDSIFGGVKPEDHKRRADIVRDNTNWIRGELGNGNSGIMRYFSGKYPKDSARAPKLKQFRQNFISWFESKKPEFVADKREFEFDCIDIRMHYGHESKEELLKRIAKLIAKTDAVKDEKVRQGRIDTFIGFYYDFGEYEMALTLADRVKDPLAACWKRYSVCRTAAEHGAKGDWWKNCLSHLDEYLERKPTDEGMVKRVKYLIGQLCRDRLGNPQRALKVFSELSDPPGSLWELVWTYRVLNERKKAEMVLNEIASIFTDQAPRAVWTLAQYCEKDGERKKAVALYRRLLSQPEWKQTTESSWAHQALERLGEKTGGAMINEVR